MKNPSQAGWWSRTTGWAAAVVTLAASLAVAPSIARAACAGDCNDNGTVTIDEVITLVDIALGTKEASVCTSGVVPPGTPVTVAVTIQAVNSALNGCGGAAVCGDGITQSGEDCDPGSICIGNAKAGDPCKADADCCPNGDCTGVDGVCDTFGQKGNPGTAPRKVCTEDSQCGGAKCIRCKTFSANGCANNCTTETLDRIKLQPGVFASGSAVPNTGTSGSFVHGDPFKVPIPLNGINTLRNGKRGANGLVPIAQRPDGTELTRIPIKTISCACVRGVVFKTCGGTQYEADGATPSTDCTRDETVCNGQKPCTAVAGPGNAGEGVIGCTGLPSTSYDVVQDAGGDKCPVETVPCPNAGPVMITPGAAGPAGSEVLAAASIITTTPTTAGLCSGTDPAYGADGEFCTDDDPGLSPDASYCDAGAPSVTTLVSGTASAAVININGFDNNDPNINGPFPISGAIKSCDDVLAGNSTGAAQAGAFTSAGASRNCSLGDTAVTTVFASQCTLPADPTVIGCCADPVAGCCGNGRQEAGEACDDGNTLACGTCNANCSGPGTGKCPGPDTNGQGAAGCNANAVCESGLCVAGICE